MGTMNEPTIKIAKIAVYLPAEAKRCKGRRIPSSQIKYSQYNYRLTLLGLGLRSSFECGSSIIALLDNINLVILVHTLANDLLGDNVGGREGEGLRFNGVGDGSVEDRRSDRESSKCSSSGLFQLKRSGLAGLW